MSCTSVKPEDYSKYTRNSNFSEKHIKKLHSYFKLYSENGKTLTLGEFRTSLGLLGAKACEFICQRIFELIDKKKQNKISFEDYIDFLNMVNYGTSEEKLKYSFNFFDIEGKGRIQKKDFKEVIYSICQFFSIVSITPLELKENDIDLIYQDIISKTENGELDQTAFFNLSNSNSEFLDFFDIFNNKIIKSSIYNIHKEKLLEIENITKQISTLIQKCGAFSIKNKKVTIAPKLYINNNFERDNSMNYDQESKSKFSNNNRANERRKFSEYSKNIQYHNNENEEKDENGNITVTQSEIHLKTQQTNEILDATLFDFDIIQPHFMEDDQYKRMRDDLESENIDLKNCLIISNKVKFIGYFEKIQSTLLEIIKEVDPSKNAPVRREGFAFRTNMKENLKQEDFLNNPYNNVDSKGLIHFGNANVQLIVCMMIGIKNSINSIGENKQYYDLSFNDEAFKEYNLFNFTQHVYENENNCQFYDYAPKVFSNLRKMYKIKNEDYLKSLGPENFLGNLILFKNRSLREMCSSGKSGSFFYFSYDSKFVLKTISEQEFTFFQSILKNYYVHMKNYKNTLLQRFFGMHIIYYNGVKMHLVIMNNVFLTKNKIHYKYDLKGSKYNRISRDPLKSSYDDYDFEIPMKDLDFIDRNEKIYLRDFESEKLKNQIKIDSEFLCSQNINDYSFLLGVHEFEGQDNSRNPGAHDIIKNTIQRRVAKNSTFAFENVLGIEEREPFFENDFGGILSSNRRFIYYVGIIDIFTQFGSKKRIENMFKYVFQGPDISCRAPVEYSKRFIEFLNGIFLDDKEIET